jgi:hypothetical protein
VSAPDFELPPIELPFDVQLLDTPPPTPEELEKEYLEWWKEQEHAKRELGSVALDLIPVVGEIKGLLQAFAWEDLVTGRALSWWEVGLNVVSAIPLVHEGLAAIKVLKDIKQIGHAAHTVIHGAHTVHNFNRVYHSSHAIKPIDVLVVEPIRREMGIGDHSGGGSHSGGGH